MPSLFEPLTLTRGPTLKNRFMLAPLTNQQSHRDGVLSDEEYRWLTMRAEGGFGLTMTCATSVHPSGLGFYGQLGAHDDRHLDGLTRLAAKINGEGSHSVVQLHHAGMRTPKDLIDGPPLCPSAESEFGARAMTLDEVERTTQDFIAAAKRCERAGFHGVELHGAHGYLICQFLSADINKREDRYGGSLENRSRLLFDIVDGVRAACGKDFSLGVRLSPERFGLKLDDIVAVAQRLMREDRIDYLDMSLWDVFKEPEEAEHKGKSLLSCFAGLERGNVRLGAAGKITTGAGARAALDAGLDFVVIGRAAILHHDFPKQVEANPDFTPIALPAPVAHLQCEGLSDAFVGYMRNWKGFVEEAA
ncbi:MAG: NADH:flavin oxidoreductase [Hyphomonadaceae bacterium]|nr:MAG: NADH:flavin oxidoreductase/NADH oxidase family protein [Caulobacteraceae bacterium]MBT9446268.1 NADH:flavin oxidoreductase [Hyphomonadaceae bacterium]TPW05715.1 MAG: NADH:flavin oxidoreductase/NADH oxidase family protein [Alphaproteobacteria bacterium]